MFFTWLKRFMPKGLYARAALILLLPVLFVQLLVSVVFIQRHFADLTQQMTDTVAIELRFLIATVNDAADRDEAEVALAHIAIPLRIGAELAASHQPDQDIKPLFDLTGREVIDAMRAAVPDVTRVSLASRRTVIAWADTAHGLLKVEFSRRRVSASNPHQLLVIMIVFGGIMTVISIIFLRNQLRPIKRLANAAENYGKGRIVPFSPTGAIEVRAAGHAFLDMRARLERQAQTRTMMLSGVSHDLRTPLTRMRLSLSMSDDPESDLMLRDVDDMQRLTDAFLDFAKDDASDQSKLVGPNEILDQISHDFNRLGGDVFVEKALGPDAKIAMRPAAIKRALENLINNALRYGTKAEVGATVSNRAVIFWVEDDGPGIAADDREPRQKSLCSS